MRFLLLLLSFCPLVLHAQVSVQGKVSDNDQGEVPYAQIILRTLPDSAVIKTDITDSTGNFKLNTGSVHPHLLEVSAFAYEPAFVLITDTSSDKITIPVTLKSIAYKLNTVIATAAKPLIERKADRMVFNVASSISSIGADGYDLLKKAPGVRINDNSGIGIVGKSTVSVMIDNKLQQLGNEELVALLRSMSAENIEKIEVITTPPARYDAQGNSGIINIVTKRSGKQGLNGNIGLGYQQRVHGSQRFSENLNYRNGKINIYSTGNTNNFNFRSDQKTIVPYGKQLQSQTLDQHNNPFYNRYQLGADYNITDKALIGALYTFGTTNRKTTQRYNAPVTTVADGKLDSTLRTNADEKETAIRHVLNLNYEWRIDTTGKKLNVDVDYFSRDEKDTRDFSSQSFFPNGQPVTIPAFNNTFANQVIGISSVKADMILPYKEIEITFGAKLSSIHTISDNRFYNLYGDVFYPDFNKTSKFDYTENTQAAYISASKSWDKWEAQLGLRGENTQTTGISYTLPQTVTNNYFKLFPTAYLQYSHNEDNVFNINYSRRIGRPSYEEMNPFRQYGTGTSYETGNPFLQPSFYHSTELSYSLQSKYIFTAYLGIVDNMHARVAHVDSINNTFFITTDNAGTAYNTGASATVILNPFTWWESNIQAQGYYDKISSTYYSSTATVNGIMAWQAEVNNTFILNKSKTLLADLGFEYTSRFQYDFVVQSPNYHLDAGIKALFFDKQLTLGINGTDILGSERYRFENIYNGVIEDSYFDARCFTFNLTWKFGNTKIKAKRQRDTVTDEMSRSE